MPAGASTPANLVIGAPGNFLVDGADVGALEGNVVFRIVQNKFTPRINGVRGFLLGTSFVQDEHGEMEVGLPEVSTTVIGLLVPGAASSVLTAGVTGSPPFTATTMAVAAVAGQQTGLKLTSVTGAAVGQYVAFAGSSPALQIRQLTRVGTAGSGGTGVDISDPLSAAVANGAAVTQYTGDGGTQYASGSLSSRRLPTTAYHTVEARLAGLNGLRYVFGLRNAITMENAEFTLGDAALMAPRARFESSIDPAAMTTSDWYLTRIPADA